jgi:plasmid stability protein
MANLTIVVEDDILQQARIKALTQGTSVNAILREYLKAYAGVERRRAEALQDLLRLSQRARSRRGQRQWTQDELHER